MVKKRKVILSGVSSFVGCHLAKAFAREWDVVALTSKPLTEYEGIRKHRLDHVAKDVTLRVVDLTDIKAVSTLVEDEQPQLWIQHAGYATNYASADFDLQKALEVNVLALKGLYQALAKVGACIILTGSNAEYGPNDKADSESDACWPGTPYGLSKLAQTIEAKRLSAFHNVPTRVARLYIPVGSLDTPGKLMDHVINNLKDDNAVDLSPCLQKRDFLGVDDISGAYLKLAQDMYRTGFDVFNVCSGEARELKSLLEQLCDTMGKPTDLLNFGAFPMRPGEAMVSYGSNEKIRTVLGWEPNGLEQTFKSLLEH